MPGRSISLDKPPLSPVTDKGIKRGRILHKRIGVHDARPFVLIIVFFTAIEITANCTGEFRYSNEKQNSTYH